MRTLNTRTRKFRSTAGRIVMALVVASMIGGISVAPAFGRDYYERRGYNDNRRVYHRGYYRPRVYAPPPVVVYDPYPYRSPGISLFFPINIR
jgi:hypothetical protein